MLASALAACCATATSPVSSGLPNSTALPAGSPVAADPATTDAGAPELVAEYGGQPYGLAVDARHVYVTLHSRLVVYARDRLPGAAPLAISLPSGPAVEHLTARDGIVVGAGRELIVWDARDPADPFELARLPLRQPAAGLVWVADEVWVHQEDGGLWRVDLGRPDQPVSAGIWRPELPAVSARGSVVDVVSLGRSAVLLASHEDTRAQQSHHGLLLVEPGQGRTMAILADIALSTAGTLAAVHGDALVIATHDGRFRRLDLSQVRHQGDLVDWGRAPKQVWERGLELAFDGARLWALVPGGEILVGLREGDAWQWEAHRVGASRMAPLEGGGAAEMRMALLGSIGPVILEADGKVHEPAPLSIGHWDVALPGREGTWLVGWRRAAYASLDEDRPRPIPTLPGFDGDRHPPLDDGQDQLFAIQGEALTQWRLEPGGAVSAVAGDLAAQAGIVPVELFAADPGRLLVGARRDGSGPVDGAGEPWLLLHDDRGHLTSAHRVPLEGEWGWAALSSSALWTWSGPVVRAVDLRGPDAPAPVTGSLDFSPGSISDLEARQGIVAIGNLLGLSLVDGAQPAPPRIAGMLDMAAPLVANVAVAPPFVWAISTDLRSLGYLSVVDASVLAHPDETGRVAVKPGAWGLRARGRHAWLMHDGVVQVFLAPGTMPQATRGPPATATPALTPTPGTSPAPAERTQRAWLPRVLVEWP